MVASIFQRSKFRLILCSLAITTQIPASTPKRYRLQNDGNYSILEMRGYGSVRLRLVTVIAPQPTASQRLVMVGYGWLFLKNRITDHLNSILEIIVISSRTKDFINKQIRRTETCNICIFQSVSYSGSFQNGSRFPIA